MTYMNYFQYHTLPAGRSVPNSRIAFAEYFNMSRILISSSSKFKVVFLLISDLLYWMRTPFH